MKRLAALILMLFTASAGLPQAREQSRPDLRAAVEMRRYAEALERLGSIEKQDPASFAAGDYDYLRGRLFERLGRMPEAAANYLSVVKRASILKPYALFHLSAAARGSGNLVLERTHLDEITAFFPNSLLADPARNRRARSWFESGNYQMAAKELAAVVPASPRVGGPKGEDEITRGNRLLLARSRLLAGDAAAARDGFNYLIANQSNPAQPDDLALAAARSLDKIEMDPAAGARVVPKLTDYEHLRRASIYQFNRDFADARRHYAAIIADHPSSGIVPDAVFQTGRGYVQEGNFPEAVNWFERAVEQFPEHPIAKDALMQAGSAYARMGKYREGLKRYQDLIAKYPDDQRLDRAYLNIVDILRDEGEENDARRWLAKTQEVFRGKTPEAIALFAEARLEIAGGNWIAAKAVLDKLASAPDLGGTAVPGGTTKQEVAFLRAYALEQSRNFPEAVEAYLSIPDGLSEYYGARATERLRTLAAAAEGREAVGGKLETLLASARGKDAETNRRALQAAIRITTDPADRKKLLDSLEKVYSALPAYKKLPAFKFIDIAAAQPAGTVDPHRVLAAKLASLGLHDEAAPELEAALKLSGAAGSDLAFTLAEMHKRGDRASKAVAFAEPLWRAVPADYQVELIPREWVEMLYPAPYSESFVKHAPPRRVDPRFLLSIVRQESRYRPDVKSYAAARGLMQFISTTSDKIAAELGRADFEQDELFTPSTAILFGSQYVSNLFKLFPNQPEAVAASYNGGEDNMQRWIKRSRSNAADQYVAEIAFPQTKDYVYKVMANYRVYRMFYGEDLNAAAAK